jgi:hypothetical protein
LRKSNIYKITQPASRCERQLEGNELKFTIVLAVSRCERENNRSDTDNAYFPSSYRSQDVRVKEGKQTTQQQ